MRDVSHLSILEAAELLGGSTRLRNALKEVAEQNIIRLPTVADYMLMGPAAEEMLLAIPRIGRTSVRELWTLLHAAVGDGGSNRSQADKVLATGSSSEANAGQEESAPKTSNQQPLSPEEVLKQLNEKDREILERRFGLLGNSEETLAEIGETLDVTRERIRQIESRALGILRRRFGWDLEAFLQKQTASLWDRLASNARGAAVSLRRLEDRFLTPTEKLALAVLRKTVGELLNSVAESVEGGWIRRGLSIVDLLEAQRLVTNAINGGRLPIGLDRGDRFEGATVAAAIELDLKAGRYLDYLVRRPLTKRGRRTVRAHRILREEAARGCMPLKVLHAAYRAKYADDPCSTRDLTIVMSEAPHLFLNLYEDGWAAFGTPLNTKLSDDIGATQSLQMDDAEQEEGSEEDGSVTVAGVLRKILRESGPITFDDLRNQFMSRAGGAYSRSSVGPVLLMHSDFVRFAPGVYGLEEQISQADRVTAGQRLLLEERQLTLYCQARWGGEPAGLYPLWTPTMERAWADWAFSRDLKDSLDALLSIASIDNWPIGAAEQAKWRMRRTLCGGFHLKNRNPFSLLETIPPYVDILRAAIAARYKGGISWIGANRVRGLRVDDRHANSVLAFLVWLGVLAPTNHWQSWHGYRPEQSPLVDDLAETYIATNGAMWPKSVLNRSAGTERSLGWIDQGELNKLVEQMLAGQSLDEEFEVNEREDLDSLMREVAVRKAIRDQGLV